MPTQKTKHGSYVLHSRRMDRWLALSRWEGRHSKKRNECHTDRQRHQKLGDAGRIPESNSRVDGYGERLSQHHPLLVRACHPPGPGHGQTPGTNISLYLGEARSGHAGPRPTGKELGGEGPFTDFMGGPEGAEGTLKKASRQAGRHRACAFVQIAPIVAQQPRLKHAACTEE